MVVVIRNGRIYLRLRDMMCLRLHDERIHGVTEHIDIHGDRDRATSLPLVAAWWLQAHTSRASHPSTELIRGSKRSFVSNVNMWVYHMIWLRCWTVMDWGHRGGLGNGTRWGEA